MNIAVCDNDYWNFQWVKALRQRDIISVSGRCVPVSRETYPQVQTAYMQFLFSEAEELAQDSIGGV